MLGPYISFSILGTATFVRNVKATGGRPQMTFAPSSSRSFFNNDLWQWLSSSQ